LLIGAWAPRIPEIRADLGLTPAALGVALLVPALGTIGVAQFAGARITRHGSAAVTRTGAVLYAIAGVLPALAINLGTLCLALLLWGAAMGLFDLGMNAQGAAVEIVRGRPTMSGFHAAWSLGCFVGALVGGAGAALGVSVWAQQAAVGVLGAVGVQWLSRGYVADPPHEAATGHRFTRPETRLILLGVAAIFAFMAEGAVTDWSGVLLRDHFDVAPGLASLGYAAFSVTMTAGRLSGDSVVHRVGRVRTFAVLAAVGALGLGLGLAVNTATGAVVGFAFLGIGLSVMVPVLYSAAADGDTPPGPSIATVAALGCVGLVAGPSLIGAVAQVVNVHSALWLLPPFTVAAGALGIAGFRLGRRSGVGRSSLGTARARADR
jgi:MFS family permease